MRTLLTDQAETWHTPEKAARLLKQLNADSDGWRYEAEPAGNWVRVAVYDETGAKMGYL